MAPDPDPQSPYPTILETERLTLRLADPDIEDDCLKIVSVYQDEAASMGGNSRAAINTIQDVRKKHEAHNPTAELCTKVSLPPKGHIFFTSLKGTGEFIGTIGCAFRHEMPYPDLGYSFFRPYWSCGYASEAGRAAVAWWRDVVGVEEMWLGTLDSNARSQRTAERIGFVRAGQIDVMFGKEGGETWVTATAFILPGTQWQPFDEQGRRWVVRPTIGTESEKQRNDEIKFG